MRKLIPQSLFGQMLLLLFLGLLVSHMLSMLVHNRERVTALSLLGERAVLQRMSSLANLVIDIPPQWRSRIVAAQNEKRFRAWLDTASTLIAEPSTSATMQELLAEFKGQVQGGQGERSIKLQLIDDEEPSDELSLSDSFNRLLRLLGGGVAHQSLRGSIWIADGQWLNIVSRVPVQTGFWSLPTLASLFFMSLAVLVLCAWVIQRMTVPLIRFKEAALRLGKDVSAPPMSEQGPLEVRELSRAFNEMQHQLKQLIDNRARLLTAISHDLRTPISLLQLRLELLPDNEQRHAMQRTLEEMNEMVASVLDYARQGTQSAPLKPLELGSLVESRCQERMDAGEPVRCGELPLVKILGQPLQLRRALDNLIDNALRYAGSVEVEMSSRPGTVELRVSDEGPGIPEGDLSRVLEPFYRCEASRSRSLGGTGLGLSLVKSIVDAHQGEMELKNREQGGLQVTLRFQQTD